MEISRYQYLSQLVSPTVKQSDKMHVGILGMAEHVGNMAVMLREYWYKDVNMDYVKLVDELGDMMWFLAEFCQGLNIGLETVALNNLAKLRREYPRKYGKEGEDV